MGKCFILCSDFKACYPNFKQGFPLHLGLWKLHHHLDMGAHSVLISMLLGIVIETNFAPFSALWINGLKIMKICIIEKQSVMFHIAMELPVSDFNKMCHLCKYWKARFHNLLRSSMLNCIHWHLAAESLHRFGVY